MCTVEETKAIVRQNNPPWIKTILVAGFTAMMGIASWSLLLTIEQESAISNLQGTISTSYATLSGSIALLTNQVVNVKEVAILEAVSRNKLVDERCAQMLKRIDNLERIIEKHNYSNEP